jgi:hypothetical protein
MANRGFGAAPRQRAQEGNIRLDVAKAGGVK